MFCVAIPDIADDGEALLEVSTPCQGGGGSRRGTDSHAGALSGSLLTCPGHVSGIGRSPGKYDLNGGWSCGPGAVCFQMAPGLPSFPVLEELQVARSCRRQARVRGQ